MHTLNLDVPRNFFEGLYKTRHQPSPSIAYRPPWSKTRCHAWCLRRWWICLSSIFLSSFIQLNDFAGIQQSSQWDNTGLVCSAARTNAVWWCSVITKMLSITTLHYPGLGLAQAMEEFWHLRILPTTQNTMICHYTSIVVYNFTRRHTCIHEYIQCHTYLCMHADIRRLKLYKIKPSELKHNLHYEKRWRRNAILIINFRS